jgi:flagellar basal-body rod protein FlgG
MNSQLYTAASGLIVEQRRLDLIADNLANLSTAGFRPQRMFALPYPGTRSPDPREPVPLASPVAVAGAYDVPGRGPTYQTGNDLDLVLEDGDFLAVETPSGRRYARGGSLGISAGGELIDAAGHLVLDPKGRPLRGLGPGATVSADARVLESGEERGRLGIVRDPQRVLRRGGGNLYSADGREDALPAAPEPALLPGRLESSAADPLAELVRLVAAQRAFESYQKVISLTMNDVNRRAVNDLAG